MILAIFAIYDRIAGTYSELKLEQNVGTAHRWFADVLSQTKFPKSDFELYRLGTYCVDTGVITPNLTPEFIEKGDNE